MFIDGQWIIQDVNPKTESGAFERLPTTIHSKITAAGPFLPESKRYHLVVSYACPWAHEPLFLEKLKGWSIIFQLPLFIHTWGQMGGILN